MLPAGRKISNDRFLKHYIQNRPEGHKQTEGRKTHEQVPGHAVQLPNI